MSEANPPPEVVYKIEYENIHDFNTDPDTWDKKIEKLRDRYISQGLLTKDQIKRIEKKANWEAVRDAEIRQRGLRTQEGMDEVKSSDYTNEFEFEAKYNIDFVPDDKNEMIALLGVESDDFYHIPIQPISLKWNAEIYAGKHTFEGLKISVPDQTISVKVKVDRNEDGEVVETKDFSLKNVRVPDVSGSSLEVVPIQIIWSAEASQVEFK